MLMHTYTMRVTLVERSQIRLLLVESSDSGFNDGSVRSVLDLRGSTGPDAGLLELLSLAGAIDVQTYVRANPCHWQTAPAVHAIHRTLTAVIWNGGPVGRDRLSSRRNKFWTE